MKRQFFLIPLLTIALLTALALTFNAYQPSRAVSLAQSQSKEKQDRPQRWQHDNARNKKGTHSSTAGDRAGNHAREWNWQQMHAMTSTHPFSGTTWSREDNQSTHNHADGNHADGQAHERNQSQMHTMTDTHPFSGTTSISSTLTISDVKALHEGKGDQPGRWQHAGHGGQDGNQHGQRGNWKNHSNAHEKQDKTH